MKRMNKRVHTVDILFPLLFVLLFCFCALLVVMQGARIYEKTAAGLQENYTVRTAVSYLQEKVRECGDASCIEITEWEGQQVLIIDSVYAGETYASYIYLEDGKLKELFRKKEGTLVSLQGGQELVELDTFSVQKQENELLEFTVSADGEQETVYVRMPVKAEETTEPEG